MRTDILMVSYSRDAAWAFHALKSVEKYAYGFGGVTVVVPHGDVELFRRLTNFRVVGFNEPRDRGMLAHMAVKMQADLFCPDAEAILLQDSDTLFTMPAEKYNFIEDDKPIIYRELFENFRTRHPTRYGWKQTVIDATGIDPEFECMVRHCNVFLRETFKQTREQIERHTGMAFMDYVMSCKNEYPQTICEHACLGAVAIEKHSELYHWVNYDNAGEDYVYEKPRDRVFPFWSHGGLDKDCDRHPGRTAREVIEEILK